MLPPTESPDAGSSLPISANASALPWDSDPVLGSGTPDGRGAASLKIVSRVPGTVRHGDRHPAHGEREGREDVELVCRNERDGLDRDALRRRGPGDGQEHNGERDDAAGHATPRSVERLRYTRYPTY